MHQIKKKSDKKSWLLMFRFADGDLAACFFSIFTGIDICPSFFSCGNIAGLVNGEYAAVACAPLRGISRGYRGAQPAGAADGHGKGARLDLYGWLFNCNGAAFGYAVYGCRDFCGSMLDGGDKAVFVYAGDATSAGFPGRRVLGGDGCGKLFCAVSVKGDIGGLDRKRRLADRDIAGCFGIFYFCRDFAGAGFFGGNPAVGVDRSDGRFAAFKCRLFAVGSDCNQPKLFTDCHCLGVFCKHDPRW